MNDLRTALLADKALENLPRIFEAGEKGDKGQMLKRAADMVIINRCLAREMHNRALEARQALRSAERSLRLAENEGVTFPLGQQFIAKLSAEYKDARESLVKAGECVNLALDLWQSAGAALDDLLNLCNQDRNLALKKQILEDEKKGFLFSELAFVYNLDYKDPKNGNFLKPEIDAPLTHSVNEYWRNIMRNTSKGRAASRNAFEAVFPELAEKALTMYTDEFGVEHFIDKNGDEVATAQGPGGE